MSSTSTQGGLTVHLQPLIPLPDGTRVRYSYIYRDEEVVIEGRKAERVNPGLNAGFRIRDDDGEPVGTISRYARVEVLP